MNDHGKLLARLVEHCQRNLSTNTQAHGFLERNGVSSVNTWQHYRLGIGDAGILKTFLADAEDFKELGFIPAKGVSCLLPSGLLVPTYDPCEPAEPVGLVKVAYAQNKHRFLTPAAGLICGEVSQAERIVIADCPFLGFRLHQAGAAGVVVAEAPEVLAPLNGWLKSRSVVAVSYKATGLRDLADVLGIAATQGCHIPADLNRLSAGARTALGLPESAFAPKERVAMSPQLVRQLWEYSKERLAAGEGRESLKAWGADSAELVQVYGLGYLPAEFRGSLNRDARSALQGNKIANAIVVPAFDAQGAVVDLLTVGETRTGCMWDEPCGLIAAKVATSFDHVLVTDSFRTAAALFVQGKRNVLLLRGVNDAANNAQRLADGGVRSVTLHCRREVAEIGKVLSAAGIAVEVAGGKVCVVESQPEVKQADSLPAAAPATTPAPTPDTDASVPAMVSHDRKSERAVFKVGDAAYTVEVSTESDTRLEIRLERGGKVHIDRFDLAVEPQRKRFATSAAMKTQVPFEQIESNLVSILDAVRRLQDQLLNPTGTKKPVVELSAAEKTDALAFLKRSDLLEAIGSDLAALGWVGEENAKRLLYLATVSRKLNAPVSAALLASSGAGKSKSLETIAELTAPEDRIHVSRLTESSLYYHDGDSLSHKLLIVDEADALTPEVLVSLRVLQTRGALTQSHVVRNPDGTSATHFIEARGPVAVITSTAGKLDEQMLSRCFEIPVDESQEQTERVLNTMRQLRTDPDYAGAEGKRAKIVRRHHNLQRMLECKPVLISFADRIQFPASSVRHRRELERFLNLIEASALLHQHQRLRHKNASGEEFIVAAVRDYEIAIGLAAESIGRASDELSVNGREVLAAITSAKLSTFSMDDLKACKPDWTRYRFRAGLDELLRLEVLTSPARGRGKTREYQLHASAVSTLSGARVRMLSGKEVGELAKLGENGFANFTPRVATG